MKYQTRIAGLAIAMAFSVTACTKESRTDRSDPVIAPASAPAPSSAASPVSAASVSSAAIPVRVYKDANCGCCKEWIKHLEQNGFKVEAMDMPDLSAVKMKYGVAPAIQACHTAVVGGYTIEGHVPADLIVKLLKEKPAIAGLAVPGMPSGSPGMEGGAKEQYDVLTFDREGHTAVYAHR